MRLDRDQIDRSQLDRDIYPILSAGEFAVAINANTTLSATFPNYTAFVVSISAATGLTVTFTALDPSFSVNMAATTGLTATFTPVININSLITAGSIKRSLSDKMYTATFQFDKTTTAGPSSSIYWTKIYFWMPDYTGAWNLVFVGIVPSSNSKYTAHDGTHLVGDDTIQAYGYDFYLTHQYLSDKLLQMPNRAGVETMTPDTFVNGCLGNTIAYNTSTHEWSVVDSTKWVYGSGIYPYNVNLPSGWGTSLPSTDFLFTTKTTKAEAIQKICEYTKQIFYVRWQYVSGAWTPCAYLVDEAKIDYAVGTGGLDLPDPVYLSNGGSPYANDAYAYLTSPITLEQKGEDQYNFFTVRCQSLEGKWIQATQFIAGSDGPYDEIYNPTGTQIRSDYYEENKDIATSSDCFARATNLIDYYRSQILTWKCTLKLRSDLVLLQRLYISGYTTMIPDGTYRIIDIEYNFADGGTTNEVTISFIDDAKFKAYLNLKRIYTNTIFEIQNVVKDALAQIPKTVYGMVSDESSTCVLTFIDASTSGGTLLPPYKITSTSVAVPSVNIGQLATITAISNPPQNIQISCGGVTYTNCTCPDISALTIGDNLHLVSINRNVTVSISNMGSRAGQNILGYTNDGKNVGIGNGVIGNVDSNGKYLFTLV